MSDHEQLDGKNQRLIGSLTLLDAGIATVVEQIQNHALPRDLRRMLAVQLRHIADDLDDHPASEDNTPGTGRLSVNVTPATQEALDRIVETEHVTVTEALRRLVGYGALVYAAHLDGRPVRIGTDHIQLT